MIEIKQHKTLSIAPAFRSCFPPTSSLNAGAAGVARVVYGTNRLQSMTADSTAYVRASVQGCWT